MLVKLAALGILFAVGTAVSPAAAAEAKKESVPCTGIWTLNEKTTIRTRSAIGPFVQVFMPWGKNGWMRMNIAEELEKAKGAEWNFQQFGNETYQVFGSDPSLGKSRQITDQIIEATRVREGEEANTQYIIFAENCKHVTFYKAEGQDRHGKPGETHFYNDLRVFDKIEPPAGSVNATVAPEFFSGWLLDRTASKLTLAPKDAETVIIVPWEKSGWVWSQIAGGPYQPEDLLKKVSRVECGASQGATAIDCKGPPYSSMFYYATLDSKPYKTYGTRRAEVRVKQVDNRNFEMAFGNGDKATIALAPDGKRMTVTTKSGAATGPNRFEDDVRVYSRIEGDTWPTVSK